MTSAEATPLRVAVLGSGPRGLINAELLASSGIGSAVGFWDRTPARAEEAAARFGGTWDASARSLVARTEPDVVAILTHPSARSTLVTEAVAGGARVILIEKPVALDGDELARVERAAGDAFVVVNTQYQWMPHWRDYLARVRAGELGDILSIEGSCGVNVLEQGPHVLGLCLAVAREAGLPAPTTVVADGSGSELVDGVDVPADLTATFDLGGVPVTLRAGTSAPLVAGESVIHFQQQETVVGIRARLWVSLNQGAHLTQSTVSPPHLTRSTVSPASKGSIGSDEAVAGGTWATGETWATAESGEVRETAWPRDDTAAQTAFYRDLRAAIARPELQAAFPTRLSVAAAETRMLFAAIRSARTGLPIDLA